MRDRAVSHRFADMIDAIGRIRDTLDGVALDAFEADWQKRWLVERGLQIISEASRHLTHAIKARHPDVPWSRVAAIGNVLRHAYDRVAPDVLWRLARNDLDRLLDICRVERRSALANEAERQPDDR